MRFPESGAIRPKSAPSRAQQPTSPDTILPLFCNGNPMNALRAQHKTPVALLLSMLAVPFVAHASSDDYLKTYSVGNHPEVRVQTNDSSVRVVTSDTNQVEFRVHSEGVRAALGFGGQVKVDSHQSGNRVELTVTATPSFTIGIDIRRLETEVHMPKDADLLIDTHDGAIELSAINGNITIHTRDGSIKATELSGRIDLDTSDGGISAASLKGEARLHSGDGAIEADSMDGKLDASTSDGSIHVEGRFDALDVKSGDGTVAARIARGSKMTSDWRVESKEGSVRVSIPADLRANLDVSTKEGSLNVNLPVTVQGMSSRSEIRGTFNGGGPLLTVRTSDGSIHLDSI